MKASKSSFDKKLNDITIKTGTTEDFFKKIKKVMKNLDEGKPIVASYTITFEDPMEMLHFLNEGKINLINVIRTGPDSITNIAKKANRSREAVSRDIKEMAKYGLVKIINAINPGHGRHKIIGLEANQLKLEAVI